MEKLDGPKAYEALSDAQPHVRADPPIGAVLSRRTLVAAGRSTQTLGVIEDIAVSSSTSHIRHGQGSVRPYLHGPVELPEFLQQVFGAVEVERFKFGPTSFHVELRIEDATVVVEAGDLPPDVEAWTGAVYVYVPDVDAVYARAVALGAKPLAPIDDKPYQERQAGFVDGGGNTWWIATYKP